jgi:predicted DNA-binding transcriptional regulator YafY
MGGILEIVVQTSARLLRLLSLLQARPEWAGQDLAERLGITARTLRRDVQKLRGLGYPVQATPGVAGGYRLGSGAALPPLLLDDDEAVAVALSLRTAASHAVSGVSEASVRALAKLEQMLPARLRDRAGAVGRATVPLTGAAPEVDADVLTTIARACRSRERLAFSYRRGPAAEITARLVEPHQLVQAGNRWYLVARDTERDDWRTFRVDRIAAPRGTGQRFVPRDPPDAAAFVANAVTTAPYRYRARVLIRAPAGQVAVEVPPTVGVVEPAPAPAGVFAADGGDGQSCSILTSGSDSLDALTWHLSRIGYDFAVLEPPELAERVEAVADRLQRAARATRLHSAQLRK